jgi:hypothetical protein
MYTGVTSEPLAVFVLTLDGWELGVVASRCRFGDGSLEDLGESHVSVQMCYD